MPDAFLNEIGMALQNYTILRMLIISFYISIDIHNLTAV